MGTIVTRKRKDGTLGHTAQIRLKAGGKLVFTQTKTFDRKPAAQAWLKKRETELAMPGALIKRVDPLLSDVIDQYNKDTLRPHGKTKDQVLRTIQRAGIGQLPCSQVTSQQLVAFAQGIDAQPSTRGNYMSHLASVFAVARPAWGYPLDKQAMDDARTVLEKLGLVGRSKHRSRRPSLDELGRLMAYYETMQIKRADAIPMQRLILFAIFSTRRQDEICRVRWPDLDAQNLELLVRDMKNPGEKIGNDVRTTLTPEALQLIELQPRAGNKSDKKTGTKADAIWPYNAESAGASFRRACEWLEIEDLHFHDLRHEGISRLFELGWTIPRVATVSGHRSWASLQRYTHLRQTGDKYAGWPWLAKVGMAPTNAKKPA